MAALASVAVVAAACSSSGGSTGGSSSSGGASSSSSAGGSASAGVATAKATMAKYLAAQPAIDIPALPAKPASGRSLTMIACGLPACQAPAQAAQAAAKALGWHYTELTTPLTPEGYIATFTQAIQGKPNFLIFEGLFPNSTVQTQLQSAKSAGIKVVGISASSAPDSLMLANYSGSSEYISSGKLQANIVVADSNGKADTLYVRDPSLDSIFGPELAAYKSTLASLCPSCHNTDLAISTANVGRTVPGQIVSALQQHSDIKYVVIPVDDDLAGVYAALASAGMADTVKLIGQTPNKQSLAAIRAGQEFASVGDENGTAGWRAVDGLARLDAGISIGDTAPSGWTQIFTKDNAPSDSDLSAQGTPKVPGDPDAFLSAWHVSS